MQPDLFASSSLSAREMLMPKAREGKLFYSISQVASMTGRSPFEVRYAITVTYHLDALKLGEEYRVPYSAVLDYLDYLENKSGDFEELDGSRDYDPGRTALYIYLSNMPHGRRPKGRRPYDDLPGKEETAPVDWYLLQRLPLPHKASAGEWAGILGVPSLLVRQTFGCRWSDMVPWPEMYDWLVSCEVVNLPVPFDAAGEAEVSEEQPSLF